MGGLRRESGRPRLGAPPLRVYALAAASTEPTWSRMATRTWVLLGLAAAVFAGLGRVREPLDLTRASGAREAARMVAGWSPADRRRAVAALTGRPPRPRAAVHGAGCG